MVGSRPTRRRFLQGFGGVAVGGALVAGGSELGWADSHDDESWSQFGYNDANTGYAPDNTGPVDNIQESWSVRNNGIVASSPAVADSTVYVGSDDLTIYALSEETVDTTATETTTTDTTTPTETTTTDTETGTSPSTDTPGSTSTASPTETTSSEAPPTMDRTSTESETGAGPTTGPGTGTDTDRQDTDQTDTEQEETGTESRETPGFGIGTALVSLGSGAHMLKRRLDSEEDG